MGVHARLQIRAETVILPFSGPRVYVNTLTAHLAVVLGKLSTLYETSERQVSIQMIQKTYKRHLLAV